MPTNKKRVNLTISEDIYEKLQAYKAENAIDSDATACLQLVRLQLKAQEQTKLMWEAIGKLSPSDVKKLSSEGLDYLLEEQAKKK